MRGLNAWPLPKRTIPLDEISTTTWKCRCGNSGVGWYRSEHRASATETFYFSPLHETTDCALESLTNAALVDYFLERLGDLEIEDISLRGDTRDLGSAGILAHSRPLRVKGWTRLGFEA